MIKYKKRIKYKYILAEDYVYQTELKTPTRLKMKYLSLDQDGSLKIKKGYAWDGPSGPTIDTKSYLRGSLVHDALYQLMREGQLLYKNRKYADRLLRQICLAAGMCPLRAWIAYWAVRVCGASCAKCDIKYAP
jgi:hypothetical protein